MYDVQIRVKIFSWGWHCGIVGWTVIRNARPHLGTELSPAALLPIQLTTSGSGKSVEDDPNAWPLSPCGRPGGSPWLHPWLLLPFGEWTRGWKDLSYSLSVCNFAFHASELSLTPDLYLTNNLSSLCGKKKSLISFNHFFLLPLSALPNLW